MPVEKSIRFIKPLFLCYLLLASTQVQAQIKSGVYKAFERTDHQKSTRFATIYGHMVTAYVEGDSLFLSKSPVIVKRRDTVYSASDGGFYYSVGRLTAGDMHYFITLYHNNCDYCGVMQEKDPTTNTTHPVVRVQQYPLTVIDGGFDLDGVTYRYSQPLEHFSKLHFRAPAGSVYKYYPVRR